MLNKFWIRDVEILAGQKKFESLGDNRLTIEFDIPFSNKKEPDVSEVKVYNLSEDTISDIRRDGYIYVNAGYKELGNKANILTGEIEDINTMWQGLDKITTIKISDGAKTWRKATLNKTYKEGTKASFIMRDLCNILAYEIVAIEPVEDLEYKLGKTITGSASASLTQLAKDTKSKLFVNKNRVVIRAEEVGYDTGFVLNAGSGLIGSPTQNKDESGDKADDVDTKKNKKTKEETKKSWQVKCLLNPRIETDSVIKVESKVLNGIYRVVSGKHSCNQQGFFTEVQVEEG